MEGGSITKKQEAAAEFSAAVFLCAWRRKYFSMKFTKFVDGKSGNAIMDMRVSERNTNIYSKIKTVALRYLKRGRDSLLERQMDTSPKV